MGGGFIFFTKQQFLLPFAYRKLNYHPQYSFETIPLVTRCEITFVTIMKVPYNLVLCCKRGNFYKLDSKIIKTAKSVLRNPEILVFYVSVSFSIPRFSYTRQYPSTLFTYSVGLDFIC